MKPKISSPSQMKFCTTFEETLDHKRPLFQLANFIDWKVFDDKFTPLYSAKKGRPAKPIRLMVGLLILKHLRNISDESVVDQWSENAYYQYFCGEVSFSCSPPCEASELVHFRKRIEKSGIELILKESIRIHEKKEKKTEKTEEKVDESFDVFIDTTVQEKNITFPTDAKLTTRIIKKCKKIAEDEGVDLRQSYTFVLKELALLQRFRRHPKKAKEARKADKKMKTIAGRLVRELQRKLPKTSPHLSDLEFYQKVLEQKKEDKQKIYSLHEREVCCISKGKEHKKYEFGNKASITRRADGVIVGAKSFRNQYDGHTLTETIEQVKVLTGQSPKRGICDRGYRGVKMVGTTEIIIPSKSKKTDTYYQKQKTKKMFWQRAGIEPVIGHVKTDHRMKINFYKGIIGDNINVMLAAAAFNFKRWLNKLKNWLFLLSEQFLIQLSKLTANYFLSLKWAKMSF